MTFKSKTDGARVSQSEGKIIKSTNENGKGILGTKLKHLNMCHDGSKQFNTKQPSISVLLIVIVLHIVYSIKQSSYIVLN